MDINQIIINLRQTDKVIIHNSISDCAMLFNERSPSDIVNLQEVIDALIVVARNEEFRANIIAVLGKIDQDMQVKALCEILNDSQGKLTEKDVEQTIYSLYSHTGNFKEENVSLLQKANIAGIIQKAALLDDENSKDIAQQLADELTA